MFRITTEVEAVKHNGQGIRMFARRHPSPRENSSSCPVLPLDPQALTPLLSAQRNVYLTGFCLFLSLVLTRTFYIIQDLMHVQDEYAKLIKAVSIRLIDHLRG
jgi:B-cell receptor-associated protein 31